MVSELDKWATGSCQTRCQVNTSPPENTLGDVLIKPAQDKGDSTNTALAGRGWLAARVSIALLALIVLVASFWFHAPRKARSPSSSIFNVRTGGGVAGLMRD
jgi:hypothetical protein